MMHKYEKMPKEMPHNSHSKLDMDKMMNEMMKEHGIKTGWRRPFKPDPRAQEGHERTMMVPKFEYENPTPDKTPDGRNINAT